MRNLLPTLAAAAVLSAGVTLLSSAPSVAQSTIPTTPTTGTGTGASPSQGLPPSTPRDLTGRSPGNLPDQATTPTAPDVIPPSNPTSTDLGSGGPVNTPSSGVGSSGG